MTENLINRISFYLASGGLFNPELADHIAVRTLLFECREALAQPEHIGFMDSKLNPIPPTRNEVLEEVAKEIEKMTAFGGDTIASFTVYIRNMKT